MKSCDGAHESVGSKRERLCDLPGHSPLRRLAHNSRVALAACIRFGFLMLLVCASYAPRSADAQSFCQSCEVQVGLGGTYHYWGATGSLVLPVSVTGARTATSSESSLYEPTAAPPTRNARGAAYG